MDGNINSSSVCINLTNLVKAQEQLYAIQDFVIVISMSVIGVLANAAFLLSVWVTPAMQSSLTAFMGNLAVTDIVYLFNFGAWGIADYVTSDMFLDFPLYSTADCYLFILSLFVPYLVSLGFVLLISVERYLAICMPVRHHLMKGKRRTVKMIIGIWAVGLAPTAVYASGFVLSETCILWPSNDVFSHNVPLKLRSCFLHFLYPKIMFISVFLVSIVFNAILSFNIIKALFSRNFEGIQGQDQVRSTLIQVTRTLVINNIVFFLCQLPIRLANLDDILDRVSDIDILSREQYAMVFVIGNIFLPLNSCINPFLYVALCRQYRHALRDTIKKLCCRLSCSRDRSVNQAEIYSVSSLSRSNPK